MIRVKCTLRDCVRWNPVPGDDSLYACLCSHPEKGDHMNQIPCPLYKQDWQKASAEAAQAAALARNKRRRG